MIAVTTVNLTPDLRTAQPDLGACDFGQVDDGQLIVLLQRFREIDAVQNHDAEPHVLVAGPAGKFIVRTNNRKLFLYSAHDTSQPGVELDAAAIADAAKSLPLAPAPSLSSSDDSAPLRRRTRNGAAVSILAAGLLLNGYTVYSFFYIDDINRPPPVQLLTNESEIASRRHAAAGRYFTGRAEGDRIIEIDAAGNVRFLRLTAAGEQLETSDSFRIGHLDSKLCLATTDNGVIELQNIDTLVYYRDTYRRR